MHFFFFAGRSDFGAKISIILSNRDLCASHSARQDSPLAANAQLRPRLVLANCLY